ncbi:outer membrane protein transport protein [Marinobacter daepoensis]|uniref:TonB-dependent receptor n=1 Tax=Marinobacter daepoensis TaxID=262077 RepID=A0ABS3B9H8_9GAMM|nr:outer membrane protein transport protein [Marinobacter daepoensis]MBN7768511.1 TonB-dependent receptor [Marinobacter daepoensis]MBY6079248.1 outer membrane protein transport protein [Marinobacter daepoensis]
MHKNSKALVKAIRLASLAAIAAPASVMAGGFSLNEQSASQMGVANAGAAANPENATTVLFNPAGMSQLSGTNLSFGAAFLDIDAEAKSGSVESGRNNPGVPVTPGSDGGDIADLAVLPNLYLTHEINDSIDVGFGIHAPYGLAADYDNDFAGRFFADKTELKAIAFTPSIAINNGQGLSMGLGLNILYAEGRLSRFQDLSASVGPAALMLEEPYADAEGDDIGMTFRVGFLYELSEATQLGLTLQTGTELELDGDLEISGIPNPANPTGPTLTVSEDIKVPLAIPESATLGIRHRLTDDVTLLAGATYARWSRFEELDIVSDQAGGPITQAPVDGAVISHVTERWKNTWQLNAGAIWQATPAWAFKAGYAWDESPVDDYVTARVPSSDRHWLTLGARWADVQSGWSVDVAVGTLLFKDDPEFTERNYQHGNPGQVAELAPGISDPSYYKAEYDLSAWSAAFEISKAF